MTSEDRGLGYNRIVVRGTLNVPQALHIGTGSPNRYSDSAIKRDGQRRPYIPGTTFAGVLISVAREIAPYVIGSDWKNHFDSLVGEGGKRSHASRLYVDDCYLVTSVPQVTEVRDYVGIDRRRQAARTNLQYDREVTPGGLAYHFELTVEEPVASDLALITSVFKLWEVLGLSLGGRTTTGLGNASLNEVRYCGVDFSQSRILANYLLEGDPSDPREYLPSECELSSDKLSELLSRHERMAMPESKPESLMPQHAFIEVSLIPQEPLLVSSGVPKAVNIGGSGEGRVSDSEFIFALTNSGDGDSPDESNYVPGSSLKGAFRSRAEKIVRTLNFYSGYDTAETAHRDRENAEVLYEQKISACAITHGTGEDIERLAPCFQNQDDRNEADELKEEETHRIYEDSCMTCRMFGNTTLRGRISFSDAMPAGGLSARFFDHVAIDRFYGGASDAKKFDTMPLMPSEDGEFRFTIHLERFEPWMLGLLALVLKDFSAQDVRLGHAKSRGYGKTKAIINRCVLLLLPESNLNKLAKESGLDTDEELDGTPFRKVVPDLALIFSRSEWTASMSNANNSALSLLEKCHGDFQNLVTNEEKITHGRLSPKS